MWTFNLPTRIQFGSGTSATVAQLPEILGKRVAVVSDQTVANLESVREIRENLDSVCEYLDVQPNPTVENVDSFATILRESQAEAILAIGGGSSLDCGKAAAFLATVAEPSIRAYHSRGKPISGRSLPVVTIPTTAGTGSEVTPIAVLDDEEKNFKGPMASPVMTPACALVDPMLTLSVPLKVTAATALDALSHCIEGFWSKNHQPICDVLAKEAAKIIFANLPKVYDDLTSVTGREALSYAALVAGIAFQMPKNAIMHACSFPLSNRGHLAHGTACAFTMEATIKLNTPYMDGRMEEFAEYCGFSSVENMVAKITELKRNGELPCTFREAGIDPNLVDLLVKESFHPLMNNNPKPVTEDDLRKIYTELAS